MVLAKRPDPQEQPSVVAEFAESGRDRKIRCRYLDKSSGAWRVFLAELRRGARPWDQTAERWAWRSVERRRTTSSRMRCATSLLLMRGRARSRPSRANSVTTLVSWSKPE